MKTTTSRIYSPQRALLFLLLVTSSGLAACSHKSKPLPVLPTRGQPLASRLALVILDELGDVVFAEKAMMANVEGCSERGHKGPLPHGKLDLAIPAGETTIHLFELIGPSGLRALAYGRAVENEGWTGIKTDPAQTFDDDIFARLDQTRWHLLVAGLRPEAGLDVDAELFEAGTRRPSERGFALAALDHELRRLILQVGSHLTLIVVREGSSLADWTISGPGADDPAVLSALGEGRIGQALALLLGFHLD